MSNLDSNWSVYAIYSLEYKRIYIGMSQNPAQRLIEHNNGKTRSTKAFAPWKIIYTEFVGNTVQARTREKELKTTNGRRFLKSLIKEE